MSDSEEEVIEIERPGDVEDINIKIPCEKDLTELLGHLVTLDRNNFD